ncbi:hypothetical protein AN219_06095, partial [Streptomyces nanshensis]
TAHPRPARAGAGAVDQAAEDGALAAYRVAEAAREEADTASHRVREALAAARAESQGEETGELAAAVAELDRNHGLAHSAAADAHAAR